jgi:hypothetical protein
MKNPFEAWCVVGRDAIPPYLRRGRLYGFAVYVWLLGGTSLIVALVQRWR